MGYLYKGDAILKGNLSVATDKPLDERSIVQNATELLSVDSAYAYNGMPVVSIEDEAVYILLDKTNITNLSAWKKIGAVTIDGNEIDLSSYITISEVDAKLASTKTEILSEVDTKIEEALSSNPGEGGGGSDVDLSGYVTKEELAEYPKTADIESIYAKKEEIPTIPNFKTINGQSITGVGDIQIHGNEGSVIIDDELTEESSNPVKSSGIYNGVKTMINSKFVVLTEGEYKAMETHDPNTFYYIRK